MEAVIQTNRVAQEVLNPLAEAPVTEKKRGRLTGKAVKKHVNMDESIKGRLRRTEQLKQASKAEEYINKKLETAIDRGHKPTGYAILPSNNSKARTMDNVAAKSWAAEAVILDCSWSNMDFKFAIVHGASTHIDRRHLWIDLLDHIQGPTVFMGDFNAVKGAHVRSSACLPSVTSCQEFCNFIEATSFIEPPAVGLRFTWSGRRFMPTHVESKIDRGLFSEDFSNLWDSTYTQALPRITSHHSPLLLRCVKNSQQGPRHLRFFHMWTTHETFLDTVAASWSQGVDSNCPIYTVMFKLKRLRNVLKDWNKSVFGRVERMMDDSQRELMEVQNQIAIHGYTEALFDREVEIQARINVALSRKSSLLQQKSRVKWLKDGDQNTNFFHTMLKYKKKPYLISHLSIEDSMVYDQNIISNHIVDYFSKLFQEEHHDDLEMAAIEWVIDPVVDDVHNGLLIRVPNEDEITAAVFGMEASSSPGPDGFTGKFFQTCWSVIKKDIWCAVQTFFRKSYLPTGCNASVMVLSPKKEVVNSVMDLRPIVLSNFFYKIIPKILATRLSIVAAKYVTKNQFGFISGRSIHDCIMLGSEGINCMKRTSGGQNMACKIDIKKAFDTLRWDFLLAVLRVGGFVHQFISWVEILLRSARLSIRYNGGNHGYFACSRGVRQGDPLSPILFGIAEDVLSMLASVENAKTIRNILDFYGGLSGQIYSPEKSNIFFSDKISSGLRREIEREINFRRGSLPFTYLGVPLFFGRIRASYLRSIHDQIVQKFSKWRGRHLSMAGRVCLVKSVIQSSLTHSMMIYRWPKSLIKELDAKCRNFIWSGDADKRHACTVAWARMCATKEEGGLGIRSFSTMNKSFLMKRAWSVIKGQDFGFHIMRARYLKAFGFPKVVVTPSSVWMGLRSEILPLIRNSFCAIGKGYLTNFWMDDWLGYKIAEKCRVPGYMHDFLTNSVADFYFEGIWHFTQAFLDNFPDVVCDILLLPMGESEDVRYWKPSLHGNVTSALAFSHHCHSFPHVSWGKWIWESNIPSRRSLVCWRILHNRMPTFDRLIKHGLIMPNHCVFCFNDLESMDHIFWQCARIKHVWRDFLGWFDQNLDLDAPDIHSFLVSAWNKKFSSQVECFWKAGILTLIWVIWTHRNKCIFEDKIFNPKSILVFIKSSFTELENNFKSLGHMSNTCSDLLILRKIGVKPRVALPPTFVNIYWWPPTTNWMKVNTDGSASGAPGQIAAGGVFRDACCSVRGCFHIKGGLGYAFKAELLGVITAVQIANARGWNRLWIESDSTYIVRLLHSRSATVPWRFAALWDMVLDTLKSFQVHTTHIFREGNKVADILAHNSMPEGWWPFELDIIKDATRSDISTHSHLRRVV
ncbi:uncharacterized protein LOC131008105 [Salvia miltiorrhiza]|uniref:uncharacterized protein LOC131008105 n=1 Tax=Salvia miltiorrhiza TaxID=226208 RepID=UPI0025AD949B|nr:uncharacterized protein LOC131008105 [Salvia miltiorrhiza]